MTTTTKRPDRTFHSAGDRLGMRRVFVNGNEVSHVIWCDTAKGIACYAPQPIKLKRPSRDEIYTRILRGNVRVEFC